LSLKRGEETLNPKPTKHNETWNILVHFFLLSFSKVQDDGCECGASSTKKERKRQGKEKRGKMICMKKGKKGR
jgi:hypothetical protein